MLIISISVSLDGFINDREGGMDWATPSDELFRFHHEGVAELGGYLLGRKLYETMLPWETDPKMRDTEFGDTWAALPKVVFSRTLERVEGTNVRLAEAPLADEIAAAVEATDKDVSIGGADLAGQAIGLGLLGEMRIFRHPVIVGGGTPLLPPVAEPVALELVETRTFGSQVVFERYQSVTATASTSITHPG